MKRTLAILLTLAMLLSMALSMGVVAGAETVTAKPFYGLGWSDINRVKFPNLEGLTGVTVKNLGNGTLGLTYADKTDVKEIAASVKRTMDRLPVGMRQLALFGTGEAFYLAPEDAIFMDKGVGQLKALFTEFIQEYKRLGGQLDGLVLDTEYFWMDGWYIYSKFYYGDNNQLNNTNIYNDIVENPKYATEVRPLLVERGFKFYEEIGGQKSEIFGIWPSSRQSAAEKAKYGQCTSIWNTVMDIHTANYLNDALYTPLMACYPEATMSDYWEDDTATWLKSLSDEGEIRGYYGGNAMKVGNASNYNAYSPRPSSSFFKDSNGTYLYKNLPAFNNAVYEDDPYHMFLFDANKFKQMYAATENRRITAWIAEYDYNTSSASISITPYYAEKLLHIGMLNPEPFLIYIYRPAFSSDAEYNNRMQVISEILNELTRLAGYSDRKPIETPINWNDGYVLSGMYANGRNLWRITPDTTEDTTLESFKVKDNVPTFSINGTTITFPQGKILEDGAVSVVGTSGYWVETPANVTPVVTRDADRYSKYPAFVEDFAGYTQGSAFTSSSSRPHQTWEVSASNSLLVESGALALTGTATLKNVTLPGNITAGDSYAKQQAWELSVTLSQAMNSGSNVKLLTTPADGGIKLEGGKVYYDENGTYKELSGVSLTAGKKYTLKREINFADATCTYSVYTGTTLLKQAANVKLKTVTLPVSAIGISCSGLTTKVLIDDYKLYANGLAADLEVYNAANGMRLDVSARNTQAKVAYRLSWMNATDKARKMQVVAAYYNAGGSLTSEKVIETVAMLPGDDSIAIGFVENTAGGKVKVYLKDLGTYDPNAVSYNEADVVAYNRSATVTASGGANIWSKPYTSGDSIRVRTAAYESKLTVVGKVTNSAGGLWYKLSDGNWVYNTNVRITDYNPADVVSCKKAFTVISWGANIWSKPYSSGDSKVVKVVDKNATLSIVAYVRNSTGGLWYQLSDGGWVYSHNVQEKSYNPADVIAYNRSATVMSSGGANIWSEPSTSGTSKRVRTEKYEAKLTVVGKVTNSAGGLWYKLSDGNWVYSTNVRITDYNPDDVETYNKTFIVTSWGANIWSKPYSSGDSKVIKTVAKDANLSIVAKVRNSTYGLWYQLSDGGWVYSANVKEKTGVSYNAADVVDHKATYVVTGWSVNVWTKPYSSGDSKVAKTVSKGATLSVVAKVTNSSGGLWYKLSDGNWIYSSNVT
ncbi:MAG: hypothetical protein IJ030_06310, partial [Oscillospiraceae bacterium]|nr:hypothetical protein [Oscillospiraceae bacterium]